MSTQHTYDILVKYNGANGMDITLPLIGYKYLKPGCTILIKNATAGVIEAVRHLISVNVTMQICTAFTKLDIPGLEIIEIRNEVKESVKEGLKELVETIPVLKEEDLTPSATPIPEVPEEDEEKDKNDKIEEVETNPEVLAQYKLKRGQYKNKTLGSLSVEQIEKALKFFSKEDRPKVEEYYRILKGE